MSLTIDPKTKIGALLDAYPALEDVLISFAPAFGQLRNPLARRTVAKVATLEMAARIGGVELPVLIRALRAAAGVGGDAVDGAEEDPAAPDWVGRCRVVEEIDADAMLARGVHPLGKALESAAALRPGEALRITSGFRPEPLIQSVRERGFAAHCSALAAGRYATHIASE